MFFSADILTNRTSGFSTAWLMATLGTKQMGGKLNKQTILGTPVPKVCEMIEEPPTGPLALRLSSQLLYGVTLIYGQQIKYLLTDVSGVKTQIMSYEENERKRRFFVATSAVDLVAVTGKRKRGHDIELQNDPAFSLDFFLLPGPPNLTVVGEERNETAEGNFRPLQGMAANTSLHSAADDITLLNESIERAAVGQRSFLGSFLYEDERGLDALDNVVLGFNFGADGELIHEEEEDGMPIQRQRPTVSAGKNLESNVSGDGNDEFDFDLPRANDDMAVYDGAQVLYEPGADSMGLDELRAAALNGQLDSEGFPRPEVGTDNPNDIAGAAISLEHNSKRRRLCKFDTDIYLSIDLLRDFRDNYHENMLAAAARRRQALATAGTKKAQTISFSEFARIAIGDPVYSVPAISRLFMLHDFNTQSGNLKGGHWDKTPPPIELGRTDFHQESADRNRHLDSFSPSIPLSGSSPLLRGGSSSRLLPALPTSDLDHIPELAQDIDIDADNELHQNLALSFQGRSRAHNDYGQPLYADGADIDPAFDDFLPVENDTEHSNYDEESGTTGRKRNAEREATVLFLEQLAPQARIAIKSFARMYPKTPELEQKRRGARQFAAAAGFSQLLKMLSSRRARLVSTETNDILFTVVGSTR